MDRIKWLVHVKHNSAWHIIKQSVNVSCNSPPHSHHQHDFYHDIDFQFIPESYASIIYIHTCVFMHVHICKHIYTYSALEEGDDELCIWSPMSPSSCSHHCYALREALVCKNRTWLPLILPSFLVDFKLTTQALPRNWLNNAQSQLQCPNFHFTESSHGEHGECSFSESRTTNLTHLGNKYIFIQLGYIFTHLHSHTNPLTPINNDPFGIPLLTTLRTAVQQPAVQGSVPSAPAVTRNCWLQYFFLGPPFLFSPASVGKRTGHAQFSSGRQ